MRSCLRAAHAVDGSACGAEARALTFASPTSAWSHAKTPLLRADAVRQEAGRRRRGDRFRRGLRRSDQAGGRAGRLAPLRADEEQAGGIIHKPMFERLILCDYAVADLTTANANVFYELGVRHAVRPATTVLLFAADGTRLPFDLAPLRTLPYQLGRRRQAGRRRRRTAPALAQTARARPGGRRRQPGLQLVDGFPRHPAHQDRRVPRPGGYSATSRMSSRRRAARARDAVRAVEQRLGRSSASRSACWSTCSLLSRGRAHGPRWSARRRDAGAAAALTLVQEQLAFALNRAGRGEDAEQRAARADRRARPEQRDLRPARARLQGPLGGRREAGRQSSRAACSTRRSMPT